MSGYVDEFLIISPSLYSFSDNTIRMYKSVLNSFDIWFGKPIETATPIDVQSYIAELDAEGKSGATLTVHTSAIRAFYDWMVSTQRVTINPTTGIKQRGRKKSRLPTYLTREEIDALTSATLMSKSPFERERDYLLVTLLLSTGLRVSEISNLKVKDFNPVDKSLRVIGKGNKEAYVFITNIISKDLSDELEEYIVSNKMLDDWEIFDITIRDTQRLIKKWAAKAGINKRVTPHTLRHTFGTLLNVELKLPIETVKEAMRHSDIRTTQKYVHSTSSDLANSLNAAQVL
jgi:integrase/recombinase XerD